MSELFDLESGWKQSEIARIFVEAAEAAQERGDESVPEAFKATEVEENKDGSVEVELEPNPAPKINLELVRAEFDSWRAQEALVRLAGQAAKNGNIKAAYLIERALLDISSIRLASDPINKE